MSGATGSPVAAGTAARSSSAASPSWRTAGTQVQLGSQDHHGGGQSAGRVSGVDGSRRAVRSRSQARSGCQNGTVVVSRPVGCPRPARVRQNSTASSDARSVSGRSGCVAVAPAGGTGEIEDEGLAVAACPFSDDVGDDAAVVVRGEFEWQVQGAGHVDAVHPQVAQIDGVDEVAECPGLKCTGPSTASFAWLRRTAGVRVRPRTVFGRDRREPPDDLRGAELGTLAYLHRRQRGFERPAVLLAVGPGPAQLADVLADGRARFARAKDMLVHRADVPGRAVGRCPPRCVVE